MAVPWQVNFSKHLPGAAFDASPAGITLPGIQSDEIVFSWVGRSV